ncbi:Metallo-dependent phosphatase-like protein [Aspergillus unguis]
MRRKTRFVCVSDTHGYTPSEAGFRLPPGDVLIHAGDLTNQGSKTELCKTMNWIAAADYEVKIVVCGNHDITLDTPFYIQNHANFHNKHPENPSECLDIITNASASILFLQHQSAIVRLCKPNGPNTIFKVFGSPYSQCNGAWAFLYEDNEAEGLWAQIPLDADVVVTHTPPQGLCDGQSDLDAGFTKAMGCKALRDRMGRVKPCLAVCGHVHEARSYERVRWASASENEDGGKDEVQTGILPPQGSKKQSLVDLTGKRAPRLDNDAFIRAQPLPHEPDQSFVLSQTDETGSQGINANIQAQKHETCIVNAAITATNWPHRGGRKFHPGPIVVDLELPVWGPDSDQQLHIPIQQ